MKATAPLLALLCITAVSAQRQVPFNAIDDDSLKVPGENSLNASFPAYAQPLTC